MDIGKVYMLVTLDAIKGWLWSAIDRRQSNVFKDNPLIPSGIISQWEFLKCITESDRKCWKVSESGGKCWKVPESDGKCWKVPESDSKCWKVSESV